MKTVPPALAPLFRSVTQCSLLATLLNDPSREWSQTDLTRTTHASQATVSREMTRLVGSGLVTERVQGNTSLYRANTAHPLHREFARIMATTFGVPAIIAEQFGALDGVDAVIVFGSWAARHAGAPGGQPGDVDVLILGAPDRDAVYEAAEAAERRIAIPVQPTIRRTENWTGPDGFLREVQSRPHLVLSANETAVAAGVNATGEAAA